MPPATAKAVVSIRPVQTLIRVIRGQKVMVDADLAALYEVPTKALNLAVRRNADRFPADFMFQLSAAEAEVLRLQSETSKGGRGGRRYLPYVFTEPRVAMLSSVLRSERAVQMNILIVRAFIRLRELVMSNREIAARVERLESGQERVASVIEILVEDIDRLAQDVVDLKAPPPARKRRIGFVLDEAKG